ncbi:MAG: hypothetical protein GY719_28010 [bacterium]|nr:hypothetical protein [bacterium]
MATGKVLWRQTSEVSYDIHAVSPVFDGNSIYIFHGYDQGGKLYELAADGMSVVEKWTEEKLDVRHGEVLTAYDVKDRSGAASVR